MNYTSNTINSEFSNKMIKINNTIFNIHLWEVKNNFINKFYIKGNNSSLCVDLKNRVIDEDSCDDDKAYHQIRFKLTRESTIPEGK